MSARAKGSVLLAAVIWMPAIAQEDGDRTGVPQSRPDESWISISGTVVAPTAEGFSLDYGDGIVTVDMPESHAYKQAYQLMEGDRATVYGRIDANLFERSTIEARRVYSEDLGTYFHPDDRDGPTDTIASYFWEAPSPLETNRATIRGMVTSTRPGQGEFTVDTGEQQLIVNTESLDYDPLDDLGFQKVEVGDTVSVSGDLDSEVFEGLVFDADRIVLLADIDDDSSVVSMPSVNQ